MANPTDQPTGTTGTMRIYDTGTNVEFWLINPNPATHSAGLPWSGTVNGQSVGGAFPWPDPGTRLVGSWAVTTSQTVSFTLGATGTSGFGGPTTVSMFISRATVPSPPTWNRVENVTPQGFRLYFTRGGDGGSPIIEENAHYSTSPTFASIHWDNIIGNGQYTDPTNDGNLSPGTTYYIRIRSRNAIGWSGWSATWTQATLGGFRVSDGSTWQTWVADVSDGTAWHRQRVDVSDGSAWRPAG